MDLLPAHVQSAALRWCEENEADSVQLILLAGLDDSFVAALGLKAGGAREIVVRRRLDELRSGLALAHEADRRTSASQQGAKGSGSSPSAHVLEARWRLALDNQTKSTEWLDQEVTRLQLA